MGERVYVSVCVPVYVNSQLGKLCMENQKNLS